MLQRQRGQHLGAEERGAMQSMKKLGYLNRSVAMKSMHHWLCHGGEEYEIGDTGSLWDCGGADGSVRLILKKVHPSCFTARLHLCFSVIDIRYELG